MIKKIKITNFLIITLTTALLLSQSVTAFAYETLNNHKLNGGVGNYGYSNRSYYITSSASNYYSAISSAMSDWIHTTSRLGITTPISYVNTTTQSSSVMDIYAGSYSYYPYTDTNAWTEFWTYSTQQNPNNNNWGWNKIYINIYNTSSYSPDIQKGVAAHEMGHCFGLDENNSNQYSIMCQMGSGRAVTESQYDDANGVNYLYK